MHYLANLLTNHFDPKVRFWSTQSEGQRRTEVIRRLEKLRSGEVFYGGMQPAVNGPQIGWWFPAETAKRYGYKTSEFSVEGGKVPVWIHDVFCETKDPRTKDTTMKIYQYVISKIDNDGKMVEILASGNTLAMTPQMATQIVLVDYLRKNMDVAVTLVTCTVRCFSVDRD